MNSNNSFHETRTWAGTHDRDPGEPSLEFRVIKILFYCVILLCSSVGNSLVIYIVAGNSRMRTPSNYLILNLAVCDLITPLLSITFDFVLEEHNYEWIYGAFMCKILWPASTLSTTASALTLAAISLDRYRVIMHPFKPRLTAYSIKVIIASIYLISTLLVVPYCNVLNLEDARCGENWPRASFKKFYTLGLSLVQYCLPLVFMVAMYTLALQTLYSTSEKIRKAKMDTPQAAQHGSSALKRAMPRRRRAFHKAQSTSSVVRGGRNEANKRATKMFIAIVVVFAVFMFPNQALWLWKDFSGRSDDNPSVPTAAIICWLFTYANSVCNAAIYASFSWDFRRGFRRAIKRLCCLNSRAQKRLKRYSSLHWHKARTESKRANRHF